MSDLISRSELIKHFNTIQQQEDAIGLDFVAIIDEIKEQPAAYDIGKVVEEFDKKYNNSLWIKGNEEFSITRNELIEIVKQEGVSDDVCEWKKEPSRLVGYFRNETSCGDSIDLQGNSELLKAFRYCPFCGKNIKVVE